MKQHSEIVSDKFSGILSDNKTPSKDNIKKIPKVDVPTNDTYIKNNSEQPKNEKETTPMKVIEVPKESKIVNESKVEDEQKSSHRANFTLGNNKEDDKSSPISQDLINNGKKILLRVN